MTGDPVIRLSDLLGALAKRKDGISITCTLENGKYRYAVSDGECAGFGWSLEDAAIQFTSTQGTR